MEHSALSAIEVAVHAVALSISWPMPTNAIFSALLPAVSIAICQHQAAVSPVIKPTVAKMGHIISMFPNRAALEEGR
jgi:hypothetical protein